jgi:hypothetical protein
MTKISLSFDVIKSYNSDGVPIYEKVHNDYVADRAAATAAALDLCSQEIRDWLILCTSDKSGPHSDKDFRGGDDVEWFEVGHNATHYFSLGVRGDGVLIQRSSGPEFNEECQCWYDSTTVRIIEPDQVSCSYWGHM